MGHMTIRQFLLAVYSMIGPPVYRFTGRRPWSFGYTAHKRNSIARILSEDRFQADSLPAGYGDRLDDRIVEYPWFFSRLPQGEGTLLDAGSVLNYEYVLRHPRIVDKRVFISTLAPEKECHWRRSVSYVYEDLRDCCFRDGYFDWVVSLSTIEHIGMDNTKLYTSDPEKREKDRDAYLLAVKEFSRVLRPGGTLYLTLPFGTRRDYGWLQVFDGAMVDGLIAAFGPSRTAETHFRYAQGGWVVSDREQSRDGAYFDIHERRDYEPDYLAASRAIVCLELTK